MRSSAEIREEFLKFFENKEHRIVDSAPVVPYDDPTLLFANAGMNQFKDVFLGTGTRDYNRATDTQKCIRVSGKHNDLEEVGHDTYHHTFFEMLGNWSFGDYYKEEAITWAWELLTEVWKLPKERLWATVYRTDDEALEIWKNKTDIKDDHILRFDEKDNFWEMGDTGPCGPCSEIHISTGDDYDNPDLVNADSPECIEIWNLVFIQYDRDKQGTLKELPNKHVDTGMGFERICAVLQDKKSNYDSDVFAPLLQKLVELSGIKYEKEEDKIAMRVVADHVRALTFAIGDGAVPGNEGRGYVLRRILRRAARYGRKLGLKDPFMFKLVDVLADQMGKTFPEIVTNRENIKNIIRGEEESFNVTLDRGLDLFDDIARKTVDKSKKVISGDDVFKLYDTFGFPVDLTMVLAKEKGLGVDEKRFDELMKEQKERARRSAKEKMAEESVAVESLEGFEMASDKPTEFTGYDTLETGAVVTGFKEEEKNLMLILDKTPFYVEAGGQVDDKGSILFNGETLEVYDVSKIGGQTIHITEKPENTEIKNGIEVIAAVDRLRRNAIMRNHSVTHFLHKALRAELGSHVQQAGSYVGPDRLRFDFTHFEKLTPDQVDKIECMVNEKIRENLPLQHHRNIPVEDAKNMGAMMFFGDKYGDLVNVVQFGDYTLEFCGGTHVSNSSQIGLFKIITETSVAAGVRRIEAVTGEGVEKYIREQSQKLGEAGARIAELSDEKKKLEKRIAELELKEKLGGLDEIVNNPADVKGVSLFKGKVNASGMDELKQMGDELRNKIKSGVGVLFTEVNGKVNIVCVVTDDLVKDKKIMAGKIVGDTAKLLGGGGGGRPHMATAGGKDTSKINEAIDKLDEIVGKYAG